MKPEGSVRGPGARVTGNCILLQGCWELNLSPLERYLFSLRNIKKESFVAFVRKIGLQEVTIRGSIACESETPGQEKSFGLVYVFRGDSPQSWLSWDGSGSIK